MAKIAFKEAGKFRRFRLKGSRDVSIEFGLKAIAHNIKKIAARIAESHFEPEKLQKTIHYRRECWFPLGVVRSPTNKGRERLPIVNYGIARFCHPG